MLNRAEMLNKRAGIPEFKANEVIKSLNIKKGSTVVDLGSGGGFYSMRFAAETGLNGIVYAVDVNKKYLDYVKYQAEKSGLTNVKTVLVDGELPDLLESSCDLIFLRNSYHHISKPEDYFMKLKPYLKSNGRVAIIDYKKTTKLTLINLIGNYSKQEDIINCMKKCGFTHINSFDFIEQQSFNIFKI